VPFPGVRQSTYRRISSHSEGGGGGVARIIIRRKGGAILCSQKACASSRERERGSGTIADKKAQQAEC